MRINKRKKNTKKTYIIVAIILLLIICALAGYFVLSLLNKDSRPENNFEITSSESDSYDTQVNTDSSQDSRELDKEPLQSDSTNVDQSSLTGYITYKNVVDGNLQIRVQIEQYLTSGTCKITVGSYTEQVDIVPNPSSSTCQGWDIPTANIGSGLQNITIDINSESNNLTLSDEVVI